MSEHVINFEYFVNEKLVNDNKVVSFLKIKMLKDRNEYKGHIPTKYNNGVKWSDKGWFIDEIVQFLQNNISSSYTLLNFKDKYSYDDLDNILKDNFPSEYSEAEKLISDKY